MASKSRNRGRIRVYRITVRSTTTKDIGSSFCGDMMARFGQLCEKAYLISSKPIPVHNLKKVGGNSQECVYHAQMLARNTRKVEEFFRDIDYASWPRIECMPNAVLN